LKCVVLAILALPIMYCYWLLITQFDMYFCIFAVCITLMLEKFLQGIRRLVHGGRSILSENCIFWLIWLTGVCALLLSSQSLAVSSVIILVISSAAKLCNDRPQL